MLQVNSQFLLSGDKEIEKQPRLNNLNLIFILICNIYNKLLIYYDRKETWTDEEKSLKIYL